MTLFLLVGVGCLFFQHQANAAVDTDFVSKIVHEFYNKTSTWEPTLKRYALMIFQGLLVLEICWLGIRSVLGTPTIHDIVKQLVILLLTASFFLAVINNYQEWSWNLINGLKTVGLELVPVQYSSDAPFITGLNIVSLILNKLSVWSPGNSIALLIAALVVIICFALISAQVVFIKCEAMIAMMAAMILVGFGASSFVKDYAVNVLKYVLSVAFKLFTMQLVLGIGISFIQSFETSTAELQDIFVIIGASVILLALVKSIPEVASSIITGSHISSGSALITASAAAFGGAIGAGASVTRNVSTIREATQIANMEGKTGLGKAAHVGKTMAGATFAARQDLQNQGTRGERAGMKIHDQLSSMKEQQNMNKEGK